MNRAEIDKQATNWLEHLNLKEASPTIKEIILAAYRAGVYYGYSTKRLDNQMEGKQLEQEREVKE